MIEFTWIDFFRLTFVKLGFETSTDLITSLCRSYAAYEGYRQVVMLEDIKKNCK